MSTVLQTINIEDFSQDKAVEINGEVFDLPKRTGELDNKISELEKKRASMKEYDFLSEIIETIFGKTNAKKIIKDGAKTNLDFMSKVYIVSLELIYEDKLKAQTAERDKQLEEIAPILDRIDKASPILSKVK